MFKANKVRRKKRKATTNEDFAARFFRENPDGKATYTDGNGVERWKKNHKPVYRS